MPICCSQAVSDVMVAASYYHHHLLLLSMWRLTNGHCHCTILHLVLPCCRACSSLRCTACDFDVLRFPGRAWDRGVDYMYFRNHMPNTTLLGAKLLPTAGAAAYCCQCAWLTMLPGDGYLCIRKAGISVPIGASGSGSGSEAAVVDAILSGSRVGGGGWAYWTCAGHE